MTPKQAEILAAQMLTPFSDEPRSEAKFIAAHLAECEPNKLLFSGKDIQKEDIESIVLQRRQGIPLQYILGSWWFYKYEFLVGEGVLVPRQDTEVLVESALDFIKDIKGPAVCDLCSGSGCIAISIAADRPDAKVYAVEKYQAAFSYLEKNIQHNKTPNVTPKLYDVLDTPFGKYNLIVCNPPYIPPADKADLSKEVLNEPHTALFGGDDGLYFYREISKNWKQSLLENGILAFEVGINEADAVVQILKDNGFINIGFKNDLIGIQRVVFGTVNNI